MDNTKIEEVTKKFFKDAFEKQGGELKWERLKEIIEEVTAE